MAKKIVLDTDIDHASGVKVGDKYILKTHAPGFCTASDAKTGRDQHVTLLAGEYLIFNSLDKMINLTKMDGHQGFWINPK